MIQFEQTKERPSIIKVIGVGGGGSNAVNHMYKLGIKGVEFIVSNTDEQALEMSPVPLKIQLGKSLTDGRGAGSIPEVGRNSALENLDEIKKILSNHTKMLFITAGMGGGTGTGAAPVIAKIAREMNILTVAIVTIPFQFEGKKRSKQAAEGIEELKKYVDTLLIISNDKLREIHGNLKIGEAFAHADNILAVAAKSIAEIISKTLHINVDFADVQTVMKDSGVAIMGSAVAEGANRAITAVENALHSPLLNDNDIEGARYILLNITSGNEEITMDEMGQINEYVQNKAGQTADIILGMGHDESLGDKISVTIIATGFKTKTEKSKDKPVDKVVYELSGLVKEKQDNLTNEIENPLEPVLKPEAADTPQTIEPLQKPFDELETSGPEEEKVIFSLNPTEDLQQEENYLSEEPFIIEKETLTAGDQNFSSGPEAEIPNDQILDELLQQDELSGIPEIISNVEEPSSADIKEESCMPSGNINEEPIEFEISLHDENETGETNQENEPLITEASIGSKESMPESKPQSEKSEINDVTAEQDVQNDQNKENIVQIKASEPDPHEDLFDRSRQRILKLKQISISNFKTRNQAEMEKEPAYKRRNIILDEIPKKGPAISRLSLSEDENNSTGFKPNGFLHDKAD
jgi:cell division protein FtsZ